ncbi:MAG TPA: 3-deoxy-manno-octulosonate cytidylyltransferase [Selenomonadales bacterium]|nr:3-deoxy-manno-octulosonate cytidylyltransferase [Selenomonadales bacterium]
MKSYCVIPARYASTRLPGKPLADIAGKPMIQHVYERAKQAKLPAGVLVATDSELVIEAVRAFGGSVVMTSADHPTGTDRLAEVAAQLTDADVIINVQGDEPLLPPAIIDELAALFENGPDGLDMATLASPLLPEEQDNPAAVKVVTDLAGNALYFSRSLIPYPRNHHAGLALYKHVGIYAYRRDFLLTFAALQPTPLEQAESLEQLRALEHGYRIRVIKTQFRSVGVDTPEDLARVNQILAKTGGQSL